MDIVDNLAKEVVRDPGAMDLESVGVAKLSRGIKTNERSNCSEHSTRKGYIETVLCNRFESDQGGNVKGNE